MCDLGHAVSGCQSQRIGNVGECVTYQRNWLPQAQVPSPIGGAFKGPSCRCLLL